MKILNNPHAGVDFKVKHYRMTCPRCGCVFVADEDDIEPLPLNGGGFARTPRREYKCVCPNENCGMSITIAFEDLYTHICDQDGDPMPSSHHSHHNLTVEEAVRLEAERSERAERERAALGVK